MCRYISKVAVTVGLASLFALFVYVSVHAETQVVASFQIGFTVVEDGSDVLSSEQRFWSETVLWSASNQYATPPVSISVTRTPTFYTVLTGTLHRAFLDGPTQVAGLWHWTVVYQGWLTVHIMNVRSFVP